MQAELGVYAANPVHVNLTKEQNRPFSWMSTSCFKLCGNRVVIFYTFIPPVWLCIWTKNGVSINLPIDIYIIKIAAANQL